VSVGSHENVLDTVLGAKSPFIPSLHLFTPSSWGRGQSETCLLFRQPRDRPEVRKAVVELLEVVDMVMGIQ
jgi:hypothetical protein